MSMVSQVDHYTVDNLLGDFDEVFMALGTLGTDAIVDVPAEHELGDFASVWSYLHELVPIPSTSRADKRSRKRVARRLRRGAKHNVADLQDLPELIYDTSASDNDGPSTDEEIVGELDLLRDKLHHVQKSFKPRQLHSPLPAQKRITSLHAKLPSLTPLTNSPAHIFVDSSNIYLGFQQLLQEQYPESYPAFSHKKPFMDLSILTHILERGRKTSVKSLVGSSPLLQSWDAAKCLGYDVSILERVSKGSRKSEQGVDELIHLKMLESICDHEPSHMVLATGDANIAQFSGGFYHCVIRALSRGWTVDLMSFCGGLSRMWEHDAFRKQWGSSFNIIYLDDYIEELEA